jgi:ankyrin repeat protein/tetratricopeptide (TPR) repeat protein
MPFQDYIPRIPMGLRTELIHQLKQANGAAAKFDLGICYFRGRGVEPDMPEAARLVQLAATMGEPRAKMISHRFHSGLRIATSYQSALDRELEGLPTETYYPTRVRKYEQLQHLSITRDISITKQDEMLYAQQIARTGDIARVQQLLKDGFDINLNMPGSLLLFACRGGQRNMVNFLLSNGADARVLGENGISPLHWMIMFHDSEVDAVVASLIAHGADINAMVSRYMYIEEHSLRLFGTPLKFAISVRNLKLVKTLVEAGAPLDANSVSPLDVAVSNHCPEIVSFLISSGFKMSPLHEICAASNLKLLLLHGTSARVMLESTIDEVLKGGISINEQDEEGRTALANALRTEDSWSEIEALVERGATFVLPSTSLVKFLSVRSRPGATCAFLLEKGLLSPTPEFVNAVVVRGECEILEALLKFGIDVNAMDGFVSALEAATNTAGNVGVLNLLLDHGANIQKEFNGGTVLEACISLQIGDGQMIDALVERGAPLMSSSHVTILHRAAGLHSMVDGAHVISHLLKYDSINELLDVGSEGRSLNTPLYNACYHGIFEAVQALLEQKVDVDKFDFLGPIAITELNGGVPIRSNFADDRDIYTWKLKAEDIILALYDKMNPLHHKTRLQIAAKLANYERVVELVEGGIEVERHYPEKGLIESQVVMEVEPPFNEGSDYESRLLEEQRVITYLHETWTAPKPEWDPILDDSPQQLQQRYLKLIEDSKAKSGEGLETAALMSKLGEAYALEIKWAKAEPLFARVLELRENELEKNDLALFESRTNYIRTLLALNKLEEARALAHVTLTQALENLEPDCHYITMVRDDITAIDVADGRVSDASKIRESFLLQFPEEKTPAIYRDELMIKASLINDYCKLEQWGEASKLAIDFRECPGAPEDYPPINQLQIIAAITLESYSRWEDSNYILQAILKHARQTRPKSFFESMALLRLVEHWKSRKDNKEAAKWQLELVETFPNSVLSQIKLAEIYTADSRLMEAGLLQDQAIDAAIKILGEDHPTILGFKKILCKNWVKQGLPGKAEPLARDILARSTEGKVEDGYRLAIILKDLEKYDEAAEILEHIVEIEGTVPNLLFLIRIYILQNKLDEAETMCRKVLSMAQNAPEADEWTIEALKELASVHLDRGETQASCDALTEAIEIARRSQPDELWELMICLSHDLSGLSQVDKAAALQVELLDMFSTNTSADRIQFLKTKLALGVSYHELGRLEEARELCEEVHPEIIELLDDTDSLAIEVKTELLDIYYELERWQDAKPFGEDILRTIRERTDDFDAEAVLVMSYLSKIYQELELWTDADPLFEVLLKVSRDEDGDDHDNTIILMDNLAQSYRMGKKFKQAEDLMKEVVERRLRLKGEDHEDTIDAMETLFELHISTGAFVEAEQLGLNLLRLYDTLKEEDEIKIRNMRLSLARVYRRHGKYSEAEAIALHIYDTDKVPQVDVVNSVALTLDAQKRYAEAEPFYLQLLALQSCAARENAKPDEPNPFDLDVVVCWKLLANLYSHMKQWPEAKKFAELSLLGYQYFAERKGNVKVLSAMLVLQDVHRALGEEDLVRDVGRQVR